jgi:hypothetical protein
VLRTLGLSQSPVPCTQLKALLWCFTSDVTYSRMFVRRGHALCPSMHETNRSASTVLDGRVIERKFCAFLFVSDHHRYCDAEEISA